jgi:hypothetical protein
MLLIKPTGGPVPATTTDRLTTGHAEAARSCVSHVGSPAPSLAGLHPGAPQRHSQIMCGWGSTIGRLSLASIGVSSPLMLVVGGGQEHRAVSMPRGWRSVVADDARRGVVVLTTLTPILAAAVGVAITLATDGKSALLTILPGVPRVRLRPAPTRLATAQQEGLAPPSAPSASRRIATSCRNHGLSRSP